MLQCTKELVDRSTAGFHQVHLITEGSNSNTFDRIKNTSLVLVGLHLDARQNSS